MPNANTCPKCGGTANPCLIDINGNQYYHCLTGLTHLDMSRGELTKGTQIQPCDTYLNPRGELLTGTIIYASENKLKTFSARNGKEVR